jgi:hypothetical protein
MVVSVHCVMLRALSCDTKANAPTIIIQQTPVTSHISMEDVIKYHKNRPPE